jgi:hypothetical protein
MIKNLFLKVKEYFLKKKSIKENIKLKNKLVKEIINFLDKFQDINYSTFEIKINDRLTITKLKLQYSGITETTKYDLFYTALNSKQEEHNLDKYTFKRFLFTLNLLDLQRFHKHILDVENIYYHKVKFNRLLDI